jgi:hypothetical protein
MFGHKFRKSPLLPIVSAWPVNFTKNPMNFTSFSQEVLNSALSSRGADDVERAAS